MSTQHTTTAEQALEQSVLQSVMENAPLPMAQVEGREHLVWSINPAFCRMLKRSAEELIGRPFAELFPQSLRALDLMDRVLRNNKGEAHVVLEGDEPNSVYEAFSCWPIQAGGARLGGLMVQVTETGAFQRQSMAMNEALLISSVQQHELTDVADRLNVQLVKEIAERQQAEALMAAQKEAFEMAATGTPLLEVLGFLARAAESQSTQEATVAIHLLNEQGTHFRKSAAPSLPPAYNQAIDGLPIVPFTGPFHGAIARRQRVTFPDQDAGEGYADFATIGLPFGLRSGYSVAILSSVGQVLGSVAFFYREVGKVHAQDEALGDIVTRIAAIIIERDRVGEALRESDERFRTMADNIPQLAWMANADGHIFWYNRRWYDYTGTTFDQMQGWGWQSVHEREDLPKVLERWNTSIATGETMYMVFPLRGRDGLFRPFLTRVSPVKDDKGRVVRWFGTNTDITEQQEMEDQLRQNAAVMAETDRRRSEFLATLAHELRNPLAPLRSGLELLSMVTDDRASWDQTHGMMTRQLDQMVRLIDDLMDLSRITRGAVDLRMEQVDLRTILEQALETSLPLMQRQEHSLVRQLCEEPLIVRGDGMRLAQVFSNLLNNAAKYTDRGGVVTLRAEVHSDDARVTVQDNGIGIAEDELVKVFDMFAQVERSNDRVQGGLGIGLNIVKHLVGMHGGRISAHSGGLGKGSSFTVVLPLATTTATLTSPITPRVPPAPLGRYRILVVDDNEDAANMMAMLLGRWGHEVRVANNGQEAIEVGEHMLPQLIFMDLGMPIMDGHAACRRMKHTSWGRAAHIVALTGLGQEEDLRKSSEAGFDHHLVKPAGSVALKGVIAALEGQDKGSS